MEVDHAAPARLQTGGDILHPDRADITEDITQTGGLETQKMFFDLLDGVPEEFLGIVGFRTAERQKIMKNDKGLNLRRTVFRIDGTEAVDEIGLRLRRVEHVGADQSDGTAGMLGDPVPACAASLIGKKFV